MKNDLINYLVIIVLLSILLAIMIINNTLFSIIGSVIVMFGCVVLYLIDR